MGDDSKLRTESQSQDVPGDKVLSESLPHFEAKGLWFQQALFAQWLCDLAQVT